MLHEHLFIFWDVAMILELARFLHVEGYIFLSNFSDDISAPILVDIVLQLGHGSQDQILDV